MEDPAQDDHLSGMFRFSAPRRFTPRRVARLIVAATLLATACDNPTIIRPNFAYDPTALTGGLLYRWSTGARVRVFVEPTTSSWGLESSVQRAVIAWREVPQERELSLELVLDRNAADIIVYERGVPQPVVTGSCPFTPSGAAGYTYFCPLNGRAERLRLVGSSTSTAAVVIRIDLATTTSQAGLDALIAHEMGHAIGIGGHSPETTDVMHPSPSVRVPTDRDRATLRNLLGRAADITL